MCIKNFCNFYNLYLSNAVAKVNRKIKMDLSTWRFLCYLKKVLSRHQTKLHKKNLY